MSFSEAMLKDKGFIFKHLYHQVINYRYSLYQAKSQSS